MVRELRRIQRRCLSRACDAIPGARGEASGDLPAHCSGIASWAISLLFTGDIEEGRRHFDQAIALYDPAEHRPLTTRFGQDVGVAILSYRSWALWLLGYPEAALRDADDALKNAREIGQAATLMFALNYAVVPHTLCGNYAAAAAQAQ